MIAGSSTSYNDALHIYNISEYYDSNIINNNKIRQSYCDCGSSASMMMMMIRINNNSNKKLVNNNIFSLLSLPTRKTKAAVTIKVTFKRSLHYSQHQMDIKNMI